MNLMRTIQKGEDYEWVESLFRSGPYSNADGATRVPSWPIRFPFPFRLNHDPTRSYLYMVYCGVIHGYGLVSHIELHDGDDVGTGALPIRPGHVAVLDGPLLRMPFVLHRRGFQNIRYVPCDLHLLSETDARVALAAIR